LVYPSLSHKEAYINLAVIGLGKLGLPLAVLLASNGNRVKGFDNSQVVRDLVRSKTLRSSEPGLKKLINSPSTSLDVVENIKEAVEGSEVIFIIVPTPSLPSGHFSNEYVIDAVNNVGKHIGSSQRVVIDIVSTVMPGSCEGPIKSALELSSRKLVGHEVGLCYNPEFIALGSVLHDMEMPDMHLIGQSSPWAGEIVEKALQSIVKKIVPSRRMSLTEAELVKIAVNNFVTMKISFANSLLQASVRLTEIDIDVVTEALGLDTRIGNKYLKAAAPYGGPCFPRDTRALAALYQDLGISDSLSEATETVNKSHVDFIVNFICKQIKKGEKVGILGLSYKAGTSVKDESPGVLIARGLSELGFQILAWDQEIIAEGINEIDKHYKLCETSSEVIRDANFVVISRVLANNSIVKKQLLNSHRPFYDIWRQF